MNINLTLIAQALTFAAFIWFTVKFVWPFMLRAIEARQKIIANGLAAAERGAAEGGNRSLELSALECDEVSRHARERAAEILVQAEKRAAQLVDEAKTAAKEEGNREKAAAKAEIEQEAARGREQLREQVAARAGLPQRAAKSRDRRPESARGQGGGAVHHRPHGKADGRSGEFRARAGGQRAPGPAARDPRPVRGAQERARGRDRGRGALGLRALGGATGRSGRAPGEEERPQGESAGAARPRADRRGEDRARRQ